MSEIALLNLLDFGLPALSVGLERQAVLDAAKARIALGDTPEQVADFLVGMRNDAIAKAQKAITG